MRLLLRLALLLAMVPALFGACLCQGPCASDEDCPNEGEICATDMDPATCRLPLACADLGCADNQLCEEGAGADAVCLEACEDGFDWDSDARACISNPEGCAMCDALNQVCTNPIGPICGECVDGFEDDGAGNCVPSTNCDAPPADGSILEMCNSINRICVDDGMGAECGDCALGFIEVDGICELEVTCDQDLIDDCAADNRECIEAPNGQCGACLEGFVAETDADGEITLCRAPLTCADLTCEGICNAEATGANAADAFCSDPCVGPGGNDGIEDAEGNCIECGACDDAANGEDGAYLQSLFAGNRCVCDTLPGFFYDPNENDIEPCDADGDGWTRENASSALSIGDATVNAVFNCDVRRINSIVLENEAGEQESLPIDPPVELYESNRNDDQALLTVSGLIPYGSQPLVAEELNGLTKACVGTGSNADYNDNGVSDADEFHGGSLPAGTPPIHIPFLDHGYFIELHRGWYEPPGGGGSGPGYYVVREKSRLADAPAGNAVPLYVDDVGGTDGGAPDNGYWRQCSRYVSADYDNAVTAGTDKTTLDYAQHGENGGFVMGHHSQFRCMKVVSTTNAGSPPHEVTQTDLNSQSTGNGRLYDNLVTCEKTGTSGPVTGDNPSDADLTCSNITALDLANNEVAWAITTFLDYEDGDLEWSNGDNYTRGCIDECAELRNTCPGFLQSAPFNTACDGLPNNFGLLACGCAPNYGGPDCSFACPGDNPLSAGYNAGTATGNLFLSSDYQVAGPRQGIWLCGAPTATSGGPLGEVPDGGSPPSGWTLYGEVPAVVTPTDRLCGDESALADGGVSCGVSITGYTLSGAGRQ